MATITNEGKRSKIIENRILSVVAHEARNGITQGELAAFSVQLSGFQDTDARIENYGSSVDNLIESGQLVVSESEVVSLPENAVDESDLISAPETEPVHIIEEVFGSFNQSSSIEIIVVPDQTAIDLMADIVTGTAHPVLEEEDPLLIHEADQIWTPDFHFDMSPNAISMSLNQFAVADYDEDSVED